MSGSKRVLRILLIALPLLLAIFIALYFAFAAWLDALANAAPPVVPPEESYEHAVAQALLAGEAVTGYDQLDERTVHKYLVQGLKEPFDTIAIGSSRILQLTADTATSAGSFYNCGLSGADYRDVMNSFYLFEKAGMLPKNVIFCIDPWLLNSDPNTLHLRSDEALYSEFAVSVLGVAAVTPQKEVVEEEEEKSPYRPSKVKENIKKLMEPSPETPVISAAIVQGELEEQAANVKCGDGSVLYGIDYRTADIDTVEQRARLEAKTFLHMDGFLTPDVELCEQFDRFVHHMQDCGVNVIFLMVPYHPAIYDYAVYNAWRYPGFFITERWFTHYAEENGIPLYGSYNPYVAGCLEDSFYDGLHPTGEALAHIFPGMEGVERAKARGEAGSPYYRGEDPVAEQTAKRMVAGRYGIELPEVLRKEPDKMIRGRLCHTFSRYAGAEEDALLLAWYCVDKENGTIYRLDTDIDDWVVDVRFE